jgi:2-haloalkanoic acid dehalogenase type II
MHLKAVTLDAYGTLFDMEAVMIPAVTEMIAAEGLWLEPRRLSDLWTRKFLRLLHEYGNDAPPGFRDIRDMTTTTLTECYDELGTPTADVARGVEIWFDHVSASPLFPEARAAVERLAERFELALISDADDDVIAPTWKLARLPVEHVFTSHTHRAYKLDPRGTIFRCAFERLGVEPGEVVHVGDSPADVVGAIRSGAKALWVSRDGRPWTDARATPTYVARDMAEAAEMLCS